MNLNAAEPFVHNVCGRRILCVNFMYISINLPVSVVLPWYNDDIRCWHVPWYLSNPKNIWTFLAKFKNVSM